MISCKGTDGYTRGISMLFVKGAYIPAAAVCDFNLYYPFIPTNVTSRSTRVVGGVLVGDNDVSVQSNSGNSGNSGNSNGESGIDPETGGVTTPATGVVAQVKDCAAAVAAAAAKPATLPEVLARLCETVTVSSHVKVDPTAVFK